MPVYIPEYVATNGPAYVSGVNLQTICALERGSPPPAQFTRDQKVVFFDTVLALGLRAANLPADHLRDAVDPAYLNSKPERIVHEKWTSTFFHGLVSKLSSIVRDRSC